MLDVVISASLAAVTIIMAYLGVHVTLHPPNESPRAQFWYKMGFFICGVLAVSLVVTQGIRAGRAQRSASSQIAGLQKDISKAAAEAESAKSEATAAKQEVRNESSRRQQAEKDLLIAVQASGKSTRQGVAEDIRKAPINVELAGQPIRDEARNRKVRETLGTFMRIGIALRDRCASDAPTSTLDREAQSWFDQVLVYLKANLDSSFADQFLMTVPTALSPGGVPQQRVGLWHGLNDRVQSLNRFIDQLK